MKLEGIVARALNQVRTPKDSVIRKIKRIPGKLKMELIYKIPMLRNRWNVSIERQRSTHKTLLPEIKKSDYRITESIKSEGCYLTNLDAFESPNSSLWQEEIDRAIAQLKAAKCDRDDIVIIPRKDLLKYHNILLFGLNNRLLDIVSNCIGLPICLNRLDIRKDRANGVVRSIKQWHMDPDDLRMIKVIVYLNDVNQQSGPFEYIPSPLTKIIEDALGYSTGFLSDKEIASVVPIADRKSCLGKKGTIVFGAVHNVFHRIRPPTTSERFSITYTYTSRNPIRTYDRVPLSKFELQQIEPLISERQAACLFMDNERRY